MEFLNEKRLFRNGKPVEIQDIFLERKICFLEKQMEDLKLKCVNLIHCHSGHPIDNYDLTLDESKALCLEIWNKSWSEHTQILNIFKAKACLFLGAVYVCAHDYDVALEYLSAARDLMEKETVLYIIPEFYVAVCIEMSKCYIDKHSPAKMAIACLSKAEKVLESNKTDIYENYKDFYYYKLSMELKLQQAFSVMDEYSGDGRGENAGQALNLLKEAEILLTQMDFGSNLPASFLDEEWKEKQNITIYTTRGECFKNLYFQLKKKINLLGKGADGKEIIKELWQVSKVLWEEAQEGGYEEAKPRYIITLSELESLRGQLYKFMEEKDYNEETGREIEINGAWKLCQYCLEIGVSIFSRVISEHKDNTKCLNDIAALFYDYYRCGAGGERHKKENGNETRILHYLIEKYCRAYNRSTVPETIEAIIDEVLRVERTNIFALNIKSALSEKMKIPGRMGDYPALRQSSLKRWLIRMDGKCPRDSKSLDVFVEIEMCLITLYSQVFRFMDSAVINCNSEEWKNLAVGHYTKMKVLPKLINKEADARLRIRNVHHLNDTKEGVLLINRVKRELLPDENNNLLLEELWNLYDSDSAGAVRSSVYMGSFTGRLDQLNMWERYGDGGKGVSIQFNAKEYFDPEAKVSLSQISTSGSSGCYKIENIKYPLYMVIYLPDQEDAELKSVADYAGARAYAAEKRISGQDNEKVKNKEKTEKTYTSLEAKWWDRQKRLIEKLDVLEEDIAISLKNIQHYFLQLDEQTQSRLKRELCNTIMVILDLVRFLVKNDYYRDEREYRVIQYSADPECETEGTTVPKLFIPIEKELVYEKVCFGPLVTDFESKAAYILNIKKRNDEKSTDNWEIEVQKSSIRYKKE